MAKKETLQRRFLPGTRYRCRDDIRWSVEINGLYMIDTIQGETINIEYPHAAIWDFVSRGYPFDETVRLVSVIAEIDENAAAAMIIDNLHEWTKAGLLVRDV